jgi:hypothetical protein
MHISLNRKMHSSHRYKMWINRKLKCRVVKKYFVCKVWVVNEKNVKLQYKFLQDINRCYKNKKYEYCEELISKSKNKTKMHDEL